MAIKTLFAIFGNPVSHSRSPLMHNYFFKEWKIPACYGRYRLERGEELLSKFRELGLEGANVTVPFKEWAYRLADRVEGVAKEVGAVNTLVRRGEEVVGYNTDGLGLKLSLGEREFESVLILGAGGTAKALSPIYPNATILNRSPGRLEWFKKRGHPCFSWEEFDPSSNRYQLIINTTSAGLNDDSLPLPHSKLVEVLKKGEMAVDVIYNRLTPFLKLATQLGLETKDGLGMLVYQGVLAMELFLGRELPRDEVARLYFSILNGGE